MQQWTPAQVHDTIAAIVAQPAFATGQRRSLFSRFLEFLAAELNELFRLARGSIDGRIIVAAAIGVITVIVISRIVADRRLATRRHLRSAAGAVGSRRDAWTAARELAEQGEFADASHALYSAVLETLSRAGTIRFHASKTAGDYARELRRAGAPIASDFRSFARELDRVVYGRVKVTRTEFDALLQAAEQIANTTARQRAA
ncbi:MAG TPA: DUF4129 domain-containing protein [Gemmatimonadaceae bacterium]|jgi:hypothetical protein